MPMIRLSCDSRKHDRCRGSGVAADIDDSRCQLATRQLQNQLAGAATCPINPFRIDAPFEAIRRIAVQIQSPSRRADRQRIEFGRFDEQLGGRWRNFRIGAPHHAAERHGPATIGDHAHAGFEFIGLVVDRLERLARPGLADDDLAAVKLRQIESVQRLAALHEHVVGDVHDVVDRGDAERRQPRDEPRRAGADLDAANHPGRIPRAELGAFERHARQIARRDFAGPRISRRQLERPAEQHGRLAGDPDVAQAIGPIARHFEVDGQIIADCLRLLVVQPGQHQPPRQLVGRQVDRYKVSEPIEGNDHEPEVGGRRSEFRVRLKRRFRVNLFFDHEGTKTRRTGRVLFSSCLRALYVKEDTSFQCCTIRFATRFER